MQLSVSTTIQDLFGQDYSKFQTDEKAVVSLSTRLHFVCLLWPGIATTYMDVFIEYRLHSVLISVLDMVVIHCSKRPAFIR